MLVVVVAVPMQEVQMSMELLLAAHSPQEMEGGGNDKFIALNATHQDEGDWNRQLLPQAATAGSFLPN